jgi:putative endonuclease
MAAHPGHGAVGVRFDLLLVAADGGTRRIADAFRLS